ncbi:MAG: hypothetical protein HYV95_14205 [Opitutae bacterium]|nr:hypothetical protein [Opitutae bacterium]
MLVLTGCQTYSEQTRGFAESLRGGDLPAAVDEIDRQANRSAGTKDEVVYRLEQGATLRAAALAGPAVMAPAAEPTGVRAGYYRRSLAAFDQADDRISHWEREARMKLGAETSALLTNQANLPYRGRSYDKVMLNTYKALDYLALGDRDRARVELNRALQRQRDAVEENAQRIAAAQDEAARARTGGLADEQGNAIAYDVEKAHADARTGAALQALLERSTGALRPYGDYVNPFAVFLDGLFFTHLGENGSDWERGRKSLERAAALAPDNPYLRDDLVAAARGEPGRGLTYVIFETGAAPRRVEERIDIPTFLVSNRLPYISAAFPRLEFDGDFAPVLAIRADQREHPTALVASMDSVVANDFKNEWPAVVTKTLLGTAAKAIVQDALQGRLNHNTNELGQALGSIFLTVANVATSIADTRTWTALPKEFHYARLATPGSRELTLRTTGAEKTIALEPGAINVVYVKSSASGAPLLVSQFVLK